MDDRESPVDEGLRALYRGVPADAPPPALDASILSASRQAVAVRPKRAWAVPMSLAAVLVLSVAVTLRVEEERPGLEPVPLAKAPVAPQAAAPQEEAQVAVPSAPRAKSAADIVGLQPESRRERAPAAEPAPAFVPTPSAVGSSAGAAAAERRRNEAPSLSATAPAARSTADTAKRSAESAGVAVPMSPEAWLERIAELRAQSRHAEADESYAEFRRRHPDYVIAPETLRKISPPR